MAVTLRSGTKVGKRSTSAGFALPTILISSVVMLIVLLVSVSSTTAVRTAIKDQYYQQLAQVAGEAGVAYAEACLNANGGVPQWSDAAPLKPNTDCSGVELVSCPTTSTDPLCSVSLNGNIRSSFSMGKPLVEAPEVLVVGGGGGGGSRHGGGGGGGGYLYVPSFPLAVGSYPVTVGASGTGTASGAGANQNLATNGGDSSVFGLTAIGGGAGRGSVAGMPGASGGGGGGTTADGGSGTAGQGYAGGLGLYSTYYMGGGGGGAGGVGSAPSYPSSTVAAGGPGVSNSITGASITYASGGSGGVYNTNTVGVAGAANTGRGGGGAGGETNGGATGGSGVVVISYPTGLLDADGGSESTVNGKRIHRFTSDGTLNVTGVTNAVKTLPNTGYVEVLRTSTNAVWRRYEQKSAPASVVPDLCSGEAKSIYGWNNATVVESSITLPSYNVDAIAVGVGSLNPGPVYFRKDFSVIQGGTYDLSGVAGATFNAFIDGQLIISNGVAATTQTTTLSAGCHTLEVKSLNGGVQPNDFDLKMALTKSGSTIPIVKTDSSWRVSSGSLVHFSSPDYYVSASWSPVREIQIFSDTSPVWGAASPEWTTTSGNTSARWVSTTHSYTSTANYPANSSTLFRDDVPISVSTSTPIRVTYACDDTCEVWLDGSVIATKTAGASTTVFSITTTLTEGKHQFGVSVGNAGLGASGVLFAVVRTSDNVTLSSSGPGWSAANEWYPTASNPSAFSYSKAFTPNPTALSSTLARLLVVGGGGSGGTGTGGSGGGGGGGAGGLIYDPSYIITPGTYSVTVGAGGAAVAAQSSQGNNGISSKFDSLTVIGGGGGGSGNGSAPLAYGKNGGSGGGGGYRGYTLQLGALGVVGQGNNGGNVLSNNNGGGGGGSGGVGGNTNSGGPSGSGGLGGVGTANTITGSSVTYARGGSGGTPPGGFANGAANTGNGGTGVYAAGGSGAGGSGVVIISYPTGSMTATGGTITTSGGNTIHRFTSSGTFTVTSIN